MQLEAEAQDEVRDDVLSLTSELRNGLLRLRSQAAADEPLVALSQAGRAVAEAAKRWRLPPVSRCGSLLERMTSVGEAVAAAGHQSRAAVLTGLVDAVGIVERSLEGCLDGASEESQATLLTELRAVMPAPWSAHLDLDEDSFEQRLRESLRTVEPEVVPPPVPAPASAASPEADLQRELVAAFAGEAAEGLQHCEELVVRLEATPDEAETVAALLRGFHTLKGAAAAAGLAAAVEELHAAESLLSGDVEEDWELADRLFERIDSVRRLIEEETKGIRGDFAAAASRPAQPVDAPQSNVLASARAALTDRLKDLSSLSSGDSGGAVDQRIQDFIQALDRQREEFAEIADSLRMQVKSLHVIALEKVFRRLLRPARDAARREGKLVEVETAGGELQLDRAVAERLGGCLLHLVRNGVCHGIERPEARLAAGKPKAGTIRIRARSESGSLVVTVEDDGAGIDLDAVEARARALGAFGERAPTRDDLVRFIFRPGFSTKAQVDDLAGRGVGMDAVAREIKGLGGRVGVESRQGHGCTFRLQLPMDSQTRPAATVEAKAAPVAGAGSSAGRSRRRAE
jgi:two-component system chemotaxis sensor kinase CheA